MNRRIIEDLVVLLGLFFCLSTALLIIRVFTI